MQIGDIISHMSRDLFTYQHHLLVLALRNMKEQRALDVLLGTHLVLGPFGLVLYGHALFI